MRVEVTTWHLEMLAAADLRPPARPKPAYQLLQASIPCPEFNRFFYTAVGGDWHWHERLSWTYDRWIEWLDRPELETWAGYLDGTPMGYFELERQIGATINSVELAYFGLLPAFVEFGLGGHFLVDAVRRAWELGPDRVWVHTCSLDHDRALGNYQSRGFRLFKTVTASEHLPDHSPGPWPGARPGHANKEAKA